MKHIFIVNPVAGKRDFYDTRCEIVSIFEDNALEYDIQVTEEVGDATRIAEKCIYEDSNSVIYSVGGDGTLNEVFNGISDKTTLGVIPYGSGNDFFKLFSNDKENIIERTINGEIDYVDYFKLNNKKVLNIASVGFDAETAYNLSIMKENNLIPNNMIYKASVLYTLAKFKSPYVRISFNDKNFEQYITLCAICNGQYYGNGIQIAPYADCHDNLLDIYIADKINIKKTPYIVKGVKEFLKGQHGEAFFKGQHSKYDFIRKYQTDHIVIESENPIHCNYDGEICTSNRFEMYMSGKTKVLKPKKSH